MMPLLGEAVGAIVAVDPIDESVIAHAPHLRVISRIGVGYDSVDVRAATARDIVVCTTVGSNDRSVAEHTWGLILSVARRIPWHDATIRAGGWERRIGSELYGKTLGIVGFGAIGHAVARRGIAFEMRVLVNDVRPNLAAAHQLGVTLADWDTLLAESDVLSVHAALTPTTRGLFDRSAVRHMKPGAILINTSRGAIVDQEALIEALASGALAGAGLDVLAEEPPGPTIVDLLRLPNVVLTPHCAGTTTESTMRGAAMAAENVARVLEGRRPLSTVNPEVVERLGLR